MYVCKCVCMYVYVRMYVCVRMYMCVCVCICVYVCMYVCMYVWMDVDLCCYVKTLNSNMLLCLFRITRTEVLSSGLLQ
jgi:hypothetical protein